MTVGLFQFTCERCGHRFPATEISGDGYGEFVMHSESGDSRSLSACDDLVFLEVFEIVKNHPRIRGMNPHQRGDVQQAVFSKACDPGEDGLEFQIRLMPPCPGCGSLGMKRWMETSPVGFVELKPVSHSAWHELSNEARLQLIDKAISVYLDGSL